MVAVHRSARHGLRHHRLRSPWLRTVGGAAGQRGPHQSGLRRRHSAASSKTWTCSARTWPANPRWARSPSSLPSGDAAARRRRSLPRDSGRKKAERRDCQLPSVRWPSCRSRSGRWSCALWARIGRRLLFAQLVGTCSACRLRRPPRLCGTPGTAPSFAPALDTLPVRLPRMRGSDP